MQHHSDSLRTFEEGQNICFAKTLQPEALRANERIIRYLQENVRSSLSFMTAAPCVQVFQSYAPRIFVSKCIDGRVHGSIGKGYPPTTVTFARTEGNKVDLEGPNNSFWERLHKVRLDAMRHTPECPALFIALAHRGVEGSGCAAHHEEEDHALAEVKQQADTIRTRFPQQEVYALYGITNTDDGAERLIFPGGQELNTEKIIKTMDVDAHPMRQTTDVFQAEFLNTPIDDEATFRLVESRYPGVRKPRDILEKHLLFEDPIVKVAMETYLLQEVSRVVANATRNNVVFDERLFGYITEILNTVDDIPPRLKAALIYETLWNTTYTLYRRTKNAALGESHEKQLEIEHAEDKVAYGEGFEIAPRNTLVLVKPGRGNDRHALEVARKVLLKHRDKREKQEHPPIVHVNVEISGIMDDWHAFNRNVLSKLQAMLDNVHAVFGADCCVVTTYSRENQKRFYPVRLGADPTLEGGDTRQCYPCDIAAGLTEHSFTANEITSREDEYTRSLR